MAYTDKDAIYEIAEKLGYQGDEGLTTTEAVYAVAAALGYTGEHDKSVALALSDLKTVVGGGGGVDALIVTGTTTTAQGGYAVEADKTAEEIFEYVNGGGKLVFLFMPPQEGTSSVTYSIAPLQVVTKSGDYPAVATFVTTNLVPPGAQAGIYVTSMTLQGTDKVAIVSQGKAALAS